MQMNIGLVAHDAKKKLLQSGLNNNSFIVTEQDDKSPQFSVNKKPSGFQSILKSGK